MTQRETESVWTKLVSGAGTVLLIGLLAVTVGSLFIGVFLGAGATE